MLRKTQQCQTKKLTVIRDGKGNCANAQPGFSGDGVVFSEPEQKEVVEVILKTDGMFLLFFLLGSERVPATSVCLSSIKSFTQAVIQLSL